VAGTNLSLGDSTVLRLWNYRNLKAQVGSATEDEVEFSLARYEHMGRLLGDEDLEFLKSQPGFRPEIGKKFCRDRRRIFRLYLQELAQDFYRLHAHARLVVASLPAEHSALVGVLLRGQLRFWYEMTALEMRLTLSRVGVSVDARALVEAIGSMHAEIGRLSAPAAA
jgi:hypothetical protein